MTAPDEAAGTGAPNGLSQPLADELLNQPKRRVDEQCWDFPTLGGTVEVPLLSVNGIEPFLLNVGQKRIALTYKYQLRARRVYVLARLDFAAPHRNPDGEEIGVPHLHLYRSGFGTAWAYPVPPGMLRDPADGLSCLHDFMDYCQIVEPPYFQGGLF